jgi:hypothetical protein
MELGRQLVHVGVPVLEWTGLIALELRMREMRTFLRQFLIHDVVLLSWQDALLLPSFLISVFRDGDCCGEELSGGDAGLEMLDHTASVGNGEVFKGTDVGCREYSIDRLCTEVRPL